MGQVKKGEHFASWGLGLSLTTSFMNSTTELWFKEEELLYC